MADAWKDRVRTGVLGEHPYALSDEQRKSLPTDRAQLSISAALLRAGCSRPAIRPKQPDPRGA
jgi:hypothetical protein